jgi:uncharacterized protein
MTVETPFEQVVTSIDELRDLFGEPGERARDKVQGIVDERARVFIERSPFVLIATASADGHCDVSPKGDAPGFVRILDERTLVIPDRPGNRRFDGFRNILETGSIGLIFLIPNVPETLRVNGRAIIVRDEALLSSMAAGREPAQVGVVVEVEECFPHCPKAFLHASLWDAARDEATWPVTSFAQIVAKHGAP